MQLKIIFILLFTYISCIISHKCIHDKISLSFKPKIADLGKNHNGNQVIKSKERQPIRIKADYSKLHSELNEDLQSKYFKVLNLIEHDILPIAINFFQMRLKVFPLNKLYLPKLQTYCRETKILNKHKYKGVNADFLVYVTADYNENEVIAWASACFRNPKDNNRPIAAQINFNLNAIEDKLEKFQDNIEIVIHELTHALGFSPALFRYWVDENGKRRKLENVLKKIQQRGQERLILITPEIVRVAKEHFQCNNIEGIELEDNGGPASVSSHWERMILNNELLTASAVKDASFSQFTLALFKDTGWYDVDYKKAMPFYFGKGQGCEFLTHACKSKKHFREYCYGNENKNICDHGYEAKAYCSHELLVESEDCYYRRPHLNGNCRDLSNKNNQSQLFGESYSYNSKCIENTIVTKGFILSESKSGCYKAECIDQQIHVYIDRYEFVCQQKDQKIFIPQSSQYNGYIICPDYKYFCENFYPRCPKSCSGKGFCNDGVCECRPYYTGKDCQIFTGCNNDCNQNGECLQNGLCRCKQDWVGIDCSINIKDKKQTVMKKLSNFLKNMFPQSKNPKISQENCNQRGIYEENRCICFDGWTGPKCEQKKCLNDCNNEGQCIDGKCHCEDGWSGDDCTTFLENAIDGSQLELDKCPNNCNGKGKCENDQCICKYGWIGNDCSISIIRKQCPNNCSGNGVCFQNSGFCQCYTGFSGYACQNNIQVRQLQQRYQGKLSKQ